MSVHPRAHVALILIPSHQDAAQPLHGPGNNICENDGCDFAKITVIYRHFAVGIFKNAKIGMVLSGSRGWERQKSLHRWAGEGAAGKRAASLRRGMALTFYHVTPAGQSAKVGVEKKYEISCNPAWRGMKLA